MGIGADPALASTSTSVEVFTWLLTDGKYEKQQQVEGC